ncbi:HNH endonuclease [Pseudomonas chlororaphis]
MDAYGNGCAITSCNLPAVLEAAHITRRHYHNPIFGRFCRWSQAPMRRK